jgi:hypothetical protein
VASLWANRRSARHFHHVPEQYVPVAEEAMLGD